MEKKTILFVDSLIRRNESRTKRLADAFLNAVDSSKYEITHLVLEKENLSPLVGDFFEERQKLLLKSDFSHPRFRYAHQFAQADIVLIAAPFWDLSFPALLKIYIENISVDGITFRCGNQGLDGICKGTDLVFLTTRGGFYKDNEFEQGSRYLDALHTFFGFDHYHCIYAEGIDDPATDVEALLKSVSNDVVALAQKICK